MSETKNLLEVNNLTVNFDTDQGEVYAVRDVSFSVAPGEILGVVGESGSGKSVTMYAVMGLLASNGHIINGEIRFDGQNISRSEFASDRDYNRAMRRIRGNTLSMIFQDPMTFLNPVLTIEKQLTEPLLNHANLSRAQARERALELLRQVGIPSPEKRITQYPHEFSGGMRQRIIIAIALANNPKLIIADEPTTALDVTIQAQILDLIRDMARKTGSSTIMITHDLGIVASMCDRINIMYGGKVVESGTDREIFYQPNHPYTKGLLQCINNPEDDDKELNPIPGSPPDLLKPPVGCPFVDRCGQAMKICKLRMPEVTRLSDTHTSACWLNEWNRRNNGGERHA
ncbi:MAG: ABC transporter ATP-binding protein [Clostridia bacterium]|nr:ABC transporter ATP-binding protein [Clostridia bacterium]